jgi:amino acid transporter
MPGSKGGLVRLLPVLGLLYAATCGGPYGTENFVAELGPGLFLLLLLVTPWFFGIPLALTTAELSARDPTEGGYYRWARRYLGSFWGMQIGVWSLLSTLLDNALYPVLFARALAHVTPGLNGVHQWLLAVAFVVVLTYVNYRGIRLAGSTAVALNVFLTLPLIWLIAAAATRLRFNPVVPFGVPGADFGTELGTGLALTMWLYSGYSEVSTVAGEVENPTRNIPLALGIVTPLVVASYALPTLAGLAATDSWAAWTSGQFTSVGEELAGPLLGSWLFLGSVTSQAVVFLSYVLWSSRVTWAMATDHAVPAFFARLHPRYGTPHRVLVATAVGYAILAAVPFDDLLVADMWLNGAYTLLIHACLVRLRHTDGEAPQGFRVPGGRAGVWVNALVPGATWVVLLLTTARRHYVLGSVALMTGPLCYLLSRATARTRRIV